MSKFVALDTGNKMNNIPVASSHYLHTSDVDDQRVTEFGSATRSLPWDLQSIGDRNTMGKRISSAMVQLRGDTPVVRNAS